jgi:uncharacterized protein
MTIMLAGNIRRAILAAVVLGIIVAATAWFAATLAMAPVPSVVGPPPSDFAAEMVTITSTSGSRLAAWFVPGRRGAGAVLLLQGVRGTRLEMLQRARFFGSLGLAVLLMDFQATGESPGQHITFGYLESQDARAAFEYLSGRLPTEKIGIVGTSLGGAAAILSDPAIPAQAMVLEAVFASFDDAVDNRLRLYFGRLGPLLKPGLSWQFKPRLGFEMAALRPVDHISRLASPMLLIAGDADAHATLPEMQALYARAQAPKHLWVIPGAGHVDFHRDFRPAYEQRVGAFLVPLLATTK